MEEKLTSLLAGLREAESVVVALSGGVDSAVLAYAAVQALGDRAAAVTARSALLSAAELSDARTAAEQAGIHHWIVDTEDLEDPQVAANGRERCYYCKRRRFRKLRDWALEHGFARVAEGSNLDDRGDYRPGMRALEELAPTVMSPFLDAGWTKEDIRRQAAAWGLTAADKPSAACLASRIAYGIPLTAHRLRQVEKAERFLRGICPGQLRVRHHGSLARLEVTGEGFDTVVSRREEVAAALRELGFTYIALDLAGYRTGSGNEAPDCLPAESTAE